MKNIDKLVVKFHGAEVGVLSQSQYPSDSWDYRCVFFLLS